MRLLYVVHSSIPLFIQRVTLGMWNVCAAQLSSRFVLKVKEERFWNDF